MKKFFKYLFSFLLVVPFVFALTACGPSDPGDDTKNPEFAEFSSQAVAIMSAVDMNAEDGGDGLNLSSRKKDLRLMPKTEIAEVFNMVKNHIESESVDDVNAEYSSCLETCFAFPLGFGDVITNKHGATNFYGVKAKNDLSSAFDGEKLYASLVVKKTGNVTELYMFDPSAGEGVERYSYMTLTYVDKTDYKFEFVDFTYNLSNFVYAYGDSDQNFINLQKFTEDSASYAAYVSNGLSCYYVGGVKDESIQEYTEQIITEKNPLVNYLDKINATKTGAKYTVKVEDIDAIFEKYVGESSEEDKEFPIYVDEDGIVQSLGVSDNFDLETLIIPAKATTMLASGLMVHPNCTKIVIPDSITSLKTYKHIAYWYETGKNLPESNPTREDIVDAPIEYILENFMISAGYDWDTTQPIEIEFSENNKLFKTGEDGNIYLTYGEKEYLVYIKNWQTENLQTLGKLNERARNDFRRYSLREIPNYTYNAIQQIKQSNHKFKEIVFNEESLFSEFLSAKNYTSTEEYVIDKVTCYGEFDMRYFYRSDRDGNWDTKVTRIKELVIKPNMWYDYVLPNANPEDPALGLVELKAYIDQNYQGQSYDEVLDNIITKVASYGYFISINVDNSIQIDKITVDPSIERLNLSGYVSEDTNLNVSKDTQINYFDVEFYGPVDVYIDEITQQSDFEYKISPFKGKINFITNYTQSEFDYFNQKASDWEGDLVRKHIKDLTQNNSSKYSLTYAEEDINILGFENSDLTPYFDYSQLNDYAFRYTASFGDFGYNQECQLYLNNMIDEIDFTKYVLCGEGWDYKVYIQTYDEYEQQNVWVENADGKTLKNLMFSGWTKTIRCKFVATKSQTSQTKEKILDIYILGQRNWGSYSYETEFFTEMTQYTTDTVLEIKDGSGNVIADHSKLPLEYGENVFVLKCQFDSNVSYYQVKIVRQYNNRPVEYSKTEVNIDEYFSYYYPESYGFEVKIYDRAGVEVADRTKIALNVGDNIFRVVFTWKGEGEIPSAYENYDGRVEMINFIRAAE